MKFQTFTMPYLFFSKYLTLLLSKKMQKFNFGKKKFPFLKLNFWTGVYIILMYQTLFLIQK